MSFFKYLPHSSALLAANAAAASVKKEAVNPSSFISSSKHRPKIKAAAAKAKEKIKVQRSKEVERREDKIDVESCDILYIDEQIKRTLISRISTLQDLYQDLQKLIWIFNNSDDKIDKIEAEKNSEFLRRKIKDIEGGFELSFYLLRTSDILEEYKKIIEKTVSNSFVKDLRPKEGDVAKNHRKNQIIAEFLNLAKQYVNLENYKQRSKGGLPICNICLTGTSLKESDDSSIFICSCGNQVEILDDAPTFKDAERVNMSSRYTYTCRGHFNESMNRFEGKQNTEIPEYVIDILKREMKLHGLTAKTFSKDHLYMFLSENKLSDYYADINLIFFLLTNINAPDITKYRAELLEMFDQLEAAYKLIKDDDRLNSLNVNWKLYKLLQLLDYPCKKDDFFCLKTPTKQGEHEEKWYDMIEYLKSQFPDTNTSFGKRRWRHVRTL